MKQSHKRFWSAIITVLALSEFVFSSHAPKDLTKGAEGGQGGGHGVPKGKAKEEKKAKEEEKYESSHNGLWLDGVLICDNTGATINSTIHCTNGTVSVSCQEPDANSKN
eukprot:998317_1